MSAAPAALRLSFVAALGLALAACGGGSKQASPPTTTDANGCVAVSAPKGAARHETKPTAKLSTSKTYDITFATNCGAFTIRLATKTSPATTASFVGLAEKGFFDHTIFHRIVPGFVIQGGDPTGTGTGGPGYTTVDAPPASTKYTLGVAAMAKSVDEPPGAAGSQFFIVTAADAQVAARLRGPRQGRARPAGRQGDREARRPGLGRRRDPDPDRRDREGDRPRPLVRSCSQPGPRRATAG